jgi:hypothetical protein
MVATLSNSISNDNSNIAANGDPLNNTNGKQIVLSLTRALNVNDTHSPWVLQENGRLVSMLDASGEEVPIELSAVQDIVSVSILISRTMK